MRIGATISVGRRVPRPTRYNLNLGKGTTAVVVSASYPHLLEGEDIMTTVALPESNKPLEQISWDNEEALAALFNEIEEEDRQLANAGYNEYLSQLEGLEQSTR